MKNLVLFVLCLCSSVLGLLLPAGMQAQTAAIALSSYEDQQVSSVVLAGRPELDTAKLMPLLAQHAGEPFSEQKINDSVAALMATGHFTHVELELRPEANGLRVLFLLQPAAYIGIYSFPGATAIFPYSRLLQVADYREQQVYVPDQIPKAQAALATFFNRSGFFRARVKSEVQNDTEHGLANVVFYTVLGPRAKFGDIAIEGTTPAETEHLKRALRSISAVLRATSLRPGKNYGLARLERATRYLQATLGKQGYWAAKVRFIGAAYNPQTNRANLTFTVETGPMVHIGVKGAHLWPWTKNRLIPIYSENSADPDLIQEGERNLLSNFQSKDYFDVTVHTEVEREPKSVTILYRITKGKRHSVQAVGVTGNRHLSTADLLQHVPVKEAGFWPFSHGRFSQQLLSTSVSRLTAVYRAAGFREVKVTPVVKTGTDGDLSVNFRVDEGARDIVEALHIVGNKALGLTQFASEGLRLAPGKPYSESLVREDRNHIIARYLQMGYLTARFTAKAQPSNHDPHRVAVTYEISEGPQVHTSTVVIEGREHTRQSLVDKNIRMRAGEPLGEDDMLNAESRLYGLGIFDWAAVDPRRPVGTQDQDEAVVKLHEAKRNTIGYGIGFEVINRGGSLPGGTVAVPGLPLIGLPSTFKTNQRTFWGPRGTFDYSRNNMRGRGETFSVGGFAGRLDQHGTVAYTLPSFLNSAWQASTSVTGEHNSENPIFTSQLADEGLQLQRSLDRQKTMTAFLHYDFRQSSLTRLLLSDLIPPSDRFVRASELSGTFVQDTRDNPLDAHKGIYHSYDFGVVPQAMGSNFSFTRFQGQTAYYWPLPGMVWANSLRVGLEDPFAGSHVPVSERFFSGGGSTLRGFPLDGAGPQHPVCISPSSPCTTFINVPTGGDELLILNSEFRIPIPAKKGLGIVGFYDGGNVFSSVGIHGQYTNTFGSGLRYTTPIGPVRLDVGHNLNAPPGIKATQVFISVGQAF